MKRPAFLMGFVLLTSIMLRAQEEGLSKFDSLLLRAQAEFTVPDNLEEISLDYLHKIPHHIAYQDPERGYQVRIYIRPLDTFMAKYEAKSKKEKAKSMHPNDLCKSMMHLAVMDASNNQARDYQTPQYPEMSKKINNADWEAMAMVEVTYKEVDYKYCYISSLHKDDVADIYIYSLANDKNDFFEISAKMTGAIKFK